MVMQCAPWQLWGQMCHSGVAMMLFKPCHLVVLWLAEDSCPYGYGVSLHGLSTVPAPARVCPLQGRSDDNIETIKKRFRVFMEQSMPVVAEYKKIDKVGVAWACMLPAGHARCSCGMVVVGNEWQSCMLPGSHCDGAVRLQDGLSLLKPAGGPHRHKPPSG